MKTYRQKTRAGASATSNGAGTNNSHPGPDEEKIKAILERTGYSLDVTTGQRKYGGPPPGWEGASPGNGCEVSGQTQSDSKQCCTVLYCTVLHCTANKYLRSLSARFSAARFPKTFTRMSSFPTSRNAARSGTWGWWWIPWQGWTGEATLAQTSGVSGNVWLQRLRLHHLHQQRGGSRGREAGKPKVPV